MKRNLILWALAAAALTLAAAGCGPDNNGDETPVANLYIWVADQPDKEVVIFNGAGQLIRVVGGFGTFNKPNAIDVYNADGSFWVCDFYSNRVRKFSASGNPIYATPGGGAEGLLLNPTMLSVGQSNGECWIADRGHARIIRLGADGAVKAKITGFAFPRTVAVDPESGDAWVADEMNNAVVKVMGSASGEVPVGQVELARFTALPHPWAVAADANGFGWATSHEQGRVIRVSPLGALAASAAGFDNPVDVTVDETASAVYVVDEGAGRLVGLPRELQEGVGNYETVALFVVEGLSHPSDVFVDEEKGKIYVTEMGAGRVRVFDRTGKELTDIGGLAGPAAVAVWPAAGTP